MATVIVSTSPNLTQDLRRLSHYLAVNINCAETLLGFISPLFVGRDRRSVNGGDSYINMVTTILPLFNLQ